MSDYVAPEGYQMRRIFNATIGADRVQYAPADKDRDWLLVFNNHATERFEIVGMADDEIYGEGIPIPAGDAYEFKGIAAKAGFWGLFNTGISGNVRVFEVIPI